MVETGGCDFCGKAEDEVLHLTRMRAAAICDDCVDVCIRRQAEKGIIPDLRSLEEHFLFKPTFLTVNDIRGELSLYDFASLTDDDQRETFINLVADRIRKDELAKMIADSLAYRLIQIYGQAQEECGLDAEAMMRPDVLEAMRRKPEPPPEPEDFLP